MSASCRVESPAQLCIDIADWPVTLTLDGCDPRTRARLAEHYAAFLAPQQPTALSVRVFVEPGAAFIPTDVGRAWQIRSAMRGGRLEFTSHFESGWVDWASGQGSLSMRPQGDPENFLRVVYAWRCLEENSLLLHACGVIREENGHVFFGPSGSGKTTVASLSADRTVLSDDLVIIKKQDGRFRVHGVPFRGDLPEAPRTNAAADLRGLFVLAKDTGHSVARLAPSEGVALMAACVPFVMADPVNAFRVLGICADLCASVPVQALHFARDNGFWRVIDGLD
ncbi:MAG: hypothetical protein HYY30_00050 [Chloroflexi bacterium]|nr:hypothetical protein [Chloroflexota bacterium]